MSLGCPSSSLAHHSSLQAQQPPVLRCVSSGLLSIPLDIASGAPHPPGPNHATLTYPTPEDHLLQDLYRGPNHFIPSHPIPSNHLLQDLYHGPNHATPSHPTPRDCLLQGLYHGPNYATPSHSTPRDCLLQDLYPCCSPIPSPPFQDVIHLLVCLFLLFIPGG